MCLQYSEKVPTSFPLLPKIFIHWQLDFQDFRCATMSKLENREHLSPPRHRPHCSGTRTEELMNHTDIEETNCVDISERILNGDSPVQQRMLSGVVSSPFNIRMGVIFHWIFHLSPGRGWHLHTAHCCMTRRSSGPSWDPCYHCPVPTHFSQFYNLWTRHLNNYNGADPQRAAMSRAGPVFWLRPGHENSIKDKEMVPGHLMVGASH